LLELYDRGTGKIFLKTMNMLDASASPPVNGLIVVADDKRHALISGKQSQPGILNCVCVLELIDQQMLEAAAIVRQQICVITPKFMRTQQQLCEIHKPTAFADLFVGPVKRDHLAPGGISLVVKMLWPQSLIFLRIDELLNIAGHPAAVIHLETF
jgi:hypothetical protein